MHAVCKQVVVLHSVIIVRGVGCVLGSSCQVLAELVYIALFGKLHSVFPQWLRVWEGRVWATPINVRAGS